MFYLDYEVNTSGAGNFQFFGMLEMSEVLFSDRHNKMTADFTQPSGNSFPHQACLKKRVYLWDRRWLLLFLSLRGCPASQNRRRIVFFRSRSYSPKPYWPDSTYIIINLPHNIINQIRKRSGCAEDIGLIKCLNTIIRWGYRSHRHR